MGKNPAQLRAVRKNNLGTEVDPEVITAMQAPRGTDNAGFICLQIIKKLSFPQKTAGPPAGKTSLLSEINTLTA